MNLIGRRIGSYQVESQIGSGGTSVVYLARHIHEGAPAALKVLLPRHAEQSSSVERFVREAQGSTELRHPHIVPVYEAGQSGGHYYIAMQYLSGGTLEDLIKRRGALDSQFVCNVAQQITSALDFAHSKGWVHRDVKPSNILLSEDRKKAYLADFGTAKLAEKQAVTQETLTLHGTLIGTPDYMSPEQIKGQNVTRSSDIYSLGLTLYAALAGGPPFSGETASILYHQVHEMPPKITRSHVPSAANKVLQKSLAKQPDKRYKTASALASQLCRAFNRKTAVFPTWLFAVLLLGVVLMVIYLNQAANVVEPAVDTASIATTVATAENPNPNTAASEPTSTIAPMIEPTSTPRPTNTPRPTVVSMSTTGSPTPTQVSAGGLTLEFPAVNANIRRSDAELTMRWQFSRPLRVNEHFEVRFYQSGQSGFQAPFGWSKEPFRDVNFHQLDGRGIFEWNVVVVQGRDGRWERDVAESPRRPIQWEGR